MLCWARYLFLAIVMVLGTGHMIAACGQKGPLYLPEEAPPATPPAPDADVPSAPAPLTRLTAGPATGTS